MSTINYSDTHKYYCLVYFKLYPAGELCCGHYSALVQTTGEETTHQPGRTQTLPCHQKKGVLSSASLLSVLHSLALQFLHFVYISLSLTLLSSLSVSLPCRSWRKEQRKMVVWSSNSRRRKRENVFVKRRLVWPALLPSR